MRKLRSLIAVAMVMALTMSSVSAFASETNTNSEVTSVGFSTPDVPSTRGNNYPYPSSSSSLYISNTSWATIATSTTGFNCNVRIEGLVVGNYSIDVRMLDSSGNVVWSEYNAIDTVSTAYRVFWCGSNIRTIQVKAHGGNGIAWAYQV